MKKHLLSLLAITMMIATTIKAQVKYNYSWVNPFFSTAPSGSDPSGLSAIDASGNVYIAGSFKNTITIGTTVLTSAGGYDIYLAKYDAKGKVLWAKRAGGVDDDVCYAITADAQGNSYLTASYKQTATFDTITVVSQGYDDFYAAKYDTDGNVVWVNTGNGPLDAFGNGISVDKLGNVYVTGQIWGNNNFSGINITSNLWNTILVKYRPNGKIVYAEVINTSGYSGGRSLAVDSGGNCFWAGNYAGSGSFGSTSLTASGTGDCFLTKLDSLGNFFWAKDIGGIGSTSIWDNGLKLDKLGNVYLSGYFNNTIHVGSNVLTSKGSTDVFLLKATPSGNFVWVKSYGGVDAESDVNCDIDKNGNLFIINSYIGSTTVNDSSFVATDGSTAENFTIVEYDANGNFVYAKNINGTFNVPTSIKVDTLGNIYTTSAFNGKCIFDSYTLTNAGNSNGVVIGKLAYITKISTNISYFTPTTAATGTTLTIKGSGFTGATAVSFGGDTAASFSVVNDSTITAVVGSGASGNVVVVSPNGTDSLSGFVYNANIGIPTNGLVAWYPFTGNAIDSSGNGNNGTVNGATLTTDRFGNTNCAYSFNGSSNYIFVNPISALSTSSSPIISFAYWINVGSNSTSNTDIFDLRSTNNSDVENWVNSPNSNNFGIINYNAPNSNGQYWLGNQSVQTSKWIFVVTEIDFTNSSATIYLNNNKVGTTVMSPGALGQLTSPKFNIGSRFDAFDSRCCYYNGTIDDIRIYNRALDSTDVQTLYHEGGYGIIKTNISAFNPTIAATGTTVTIKGIAFTGATSVTFGGVAATSFNVLNDSTITAVVGNGASGNVVVISLNGTASLGGFTFSNNSSQSYSKAWLTVIDSTSSSFEAYDEDAGSFMNPISQKLAISTDGFTIGAIGTSNNDISIKSLNTSNGKIKFQYTYPNSGTDAGRAIQIDINGYFHTLGAINITGNERILISKIDSNGNALFNHLNLTTDSRELGTSFEIDKRTGVSYSHSMNWTGSVNLSKLHMINNAGDSITTNIITDYDWYEGWAGRMTKDGLGNYIFNGKHQTNVPYYGIVLRKVDSLGNTIWTTLFNQHTSQLAEVLKCDSIGNVIMSYEGQGGYLISGVAKFDKTTGVLLWDDVINPQKDGVRNLSILSSGNFIVNIDTGTINCYNGQNGNLIWSQKGLVNALPFSIDAKDNIYQVAGDSILILSSTGNQLYKTNVAINGQSVDLRYILADNMNGLFYIGGNATVGSSSKMFVAKYTNSGSVLPLEINEIEATSKVGLVILNWQTATELNTSHFIIQHSTDGSSFTDIGTAKAIGSGANSYSFTDNHPANGINYYRLESVDKDGATSFSKVVSVQFTVNSNQLTVYPNPSRDNVTIKGSHISSVQVINNMGRVVKIVSLKDATNPTLSVGSLPAGGYHLRIQTTDGGVSGAGFVKE